MRSYLFTFLHFWYKIENYGIEFYDIGRIPSPVRVYTYLHYIFLFLGAKYELSAAMPLIHKVYI